MKFVSATPPRLIKKYGNRRLYDTTDSAYITLEELAQRVKDGADVRILDAATSEDLTQQTLAQLLFDGRGAARFLSISLLTQLVRLGDDALADFLGRYVGGALEFYLQSRRGAQAISPLNPLVNLPFAATEALARWFTGGGAPWARQQPPPAYASQQQAPTPWPANAHGETQGYYPTPPGYSPPLYDPPAETQPAATEPAAPTETERELLAMRREIDALRAAVTPPVKAVKKARNDKAKAAVKSVKKKA